MGKRARRWALGLLAAAALALSGCSTAPALGGNVEELLRAPQAGEAQSRVLEALAAHTGGTPQLKYPRGGDEDDPMQFADLDGDGAREAAVLYLPEEGSANVCLAVLEQEGDSWHVAAEAEGLSSEVAQVALASFQPGGVQLLVGYANANLTDRFLALYRYGDGRLELVARQAYEQCLAADVTGDGCADLVLAQTGAPGGVQVQFWTMQQGALGHVQTLALPGEVVGCDSLQYSRSGLRSGIVADVRLASGGWACALLTVNGSRLALWPAGEQSLLPGTERAVSQLTPRSLDGSDTVSVAQVQRMLAAPAEGLAGAGERRLYQIAWWDYLVPEAPLEQFGVYDTATGLFVGLPTRWEGAVRLEADGRTGAWHVRRSEDGALLMSVRVSAGAGAGGLYEELAARDGVTVRVYFSAVCSEAERHAVRTGWQYFDDV